MKFNPDLLLAELSTASDCQVVVVALSGGLDSMALLHALHTLKLDGQLKQKLAAIHVNHGLNPGADDWQSFCEERCRLFTIPLKTVQLKLGSASVENLEERARNARYTAFESMLEKDECLLLGHHRDDQMETLILRLMRGSGPRGLGGIPRSRLLGNSRLLRPLLGFDRKALLEYAQSEGINWIEDDSNKAREFDRNFIRHELLPLIENRWPGYRESWAKTVQLSQEADAQLTELAQVDLRSVATRDRRIIQLTPLLSFSEPRQRNLLRHWLESIGFPGVGWTLLTRLTREIITARVDTPAELSWRGGCLQRYRDQLYALADNPMPVLQEQQWSLQQQPVLDLPGNGGLGGASRVLNEDASNRRPLLQGGIDTLTVRYRSPGEMFRQAGRPAKSLKKLFQEAGMAPWLRARQPLLYLGEELVCIPGVGIAAGFAATSGEKGYVISWQPPDLLYGKVE